VLWLCRGGGVPARASNPPADIDACSRVNCAIEIDAGCNDCCPANGPGVPTGVKTCPGSGCGAAEFDGQAEFALASVFVRIVCGTAPHEDVYPGCLLLHHSQPSALLFSPQGLEYHHLLVNRIISVETAGLPPGVAREVVLYNPQPENLTFRFGTGQDAHAGRGRGSDHGQPGMVRALQPGPAARGALQCGHARAGPFHRRHGPGPDAGRRSGRGDHPRRR
jgi:hypothetical protein